VDCFFQLFLRGWLVEKCSYAALRLLLLAGRPPTSAAAARSAAAAASALCGLPAGWLAAAQHLYVLQNSPLLCHIHLS
jgi:hypothetical protein